MGNDHVDLYWQHNWDRHTPLEKMLPTLDELDRVGKVRYLGLPNTPAWAVGRANLISAFPIALCRWNTRC